MMLYFKMGCEILYAIAALVWIVSSCVRLRAGKGLFGR